MSDYPQVTVSIGRNIGHAGIAGRPQRSTLHNRISFPIAPNTFGRPMNAYRWSEYRREVTALFMGLSADIIGFTNGRSLFDLDGERVFETSFTLYVGNLEPRFHLFVRTELAALAYKYGQDSVAVTVADPAFVAARS